jgi:hypothetical protein
MPAAPVTGERDATDHRDDGHGARGESARQRSSHARRVAQSLHRPVNERTNLRGRALGGLAIEGASGIADETTRRAVPEVRFQMEMLVARQGARASRAVQQIVGMNV